MSETPFPLDRKPDSPITKEIRDGWREKLHELFSVVVEQCEEIQGECDVVLNSLPYSINDDGEGFYDNLEAAQEIGRDEDHAMNLRAAMESQLSCLDDLFSGSMSGHYPFPECK